MDGWGIAATFFAAGAFFLALWAELRRWRHRPTWYWAIGQARHARNDRVHRVSCQLISDQVALHVHMEGDGVELLQPGEHHDHANEHWTWPHLGKVDPADDPIVLYVRETGEGRPQLRVTWSVPPMRNERIFEQLVDLGEDAELSHPRELGARPWWQRLRPVRGSRSVPPDR